MRALLLSSSALYFSASDTMRSISSLLRRPLSLVIVILFSLPVDFSTADTLRMPLASMSKVTSICGTPRGIGGMPSRWNLPSRLLSLVMDRSPSNTWINTPGWLSEYVLNVWLFFVGTVVLRGMSTVITPPAVSRPMESGATSSSSKSSSLDDLSEPDRMAACTVAPNATASSGLIDLHGSWPLKKDASIDCTFGIRVEPPTSTTSCTLSLDILASRSTFSTGCMVLRK
mmetsp:Transcript_149427/g.362933  ORF Transcript_149427/g.362933 Transcript_149427/m.362933 type:complete len:229 (-) Transcript_149427:352-1038(-)